MAFNPFDQVLFSQRATCMPCCFPAGECPCALLIPPNASPYVDYATAAAVIADPDKVPGCVSYFFHNPALGSPTSTTETIGVNTLTLDQTYGAQAESEMWSSLNLTSGETLSIVVSGTNSGGIPGDSPGVFIQIYNCAGTVVHSDFSFGTGTFTYVIPATDAYTIRVVFAACTLVACGWLTANAVLSATTLTANPVIALYDDSGTTRQLEACPKLYLPILTESSGDWYPSCADAAADIAALSSNCVGYAPSASAGVFDFLATDGGTSLTLQMTHATPDVGGLFMYGSVNLEAGETITSTGTNNGTGTKNTILVVFDDTGTSIGTFLGLAGAPAVSSALPYTGRYIIRTYNVAGGFDGTVFTCVLTSSGVLSVNQIQALYNIGLTCPARLNCGDSC